MYNKRYYPGDRVPEGTTKYYIIQHGQFKKEVTIPWMYFPEFELEGTGYHYIKAC